MYSKHPSVLTLSVCARAVRVSVCLYIVYAGGFVWVKKMAEQIVRRVEDSKPSNPPSVEVSFSFRFSSLYKLCL